MNIKTKILNCYIGYSESTKVVLVNVKFKHSEMFWPRLKKEGKKSF